VLRDHLGSASVVTTDTGSLVTGGEQRYYPFGESRLPAANMLTDKLFTGQREIVELGIYHYGARFYSPKLGRFLSADTIVPGYANPQSLNRFSYTLNNPIRYNDPSGHCVEIEEGLCVHLGEEKNTYHISERFRNRFGGDFEAEIASFIITGDPATLRYSSYGATFMAGAAIENACTGLDIDCGNYYQTIFGILASSFAALGGAYPSAGMGPGSTVNSPVPGSVRSDLGDPDCPGCGYQNPSTLSPGVERTLELIDNGGPFPYRQDGTVFRNDPVNGVRLLPNKELGYYKEYTVAAPGASYRGTERIVVGRNGEVYFTPDHYQTFYPIR
jgi:RHS repeat-associated protein